MTTRPTDEEIRTMADGCKQCGDHRVGEMLEAWLAERQAARDGVTSEVVRKAYDALLADMDPIEGVSLGCTRKALEAISAEISISEVTDEMIDKAMTAYDEFLDAEDEADYEAMRTALQSVAQPVMAPDEAVLAACRRYQERLDAVCHHHDPCEAMEDAERLALVAFREAMLSTSPQPQQAVPDGLNTAAWNLFTAYLDQYLPENAKLRGHRALAWVRKNAPLQSEMSALVAELGASLSAAPSYNGKKEG